VATQEGPETRYAKTSDGVHIAYQVLGEGPPDLVFVPPWVSDIEVQWEEPRFARFLKGLASFSRLITFDKRGTGLSDRVSEDQLPDMETRMDDVRAVLDQVGSERAALFGAFDGGHMSMVFAATYPERTLALMLLGAPAKARRAPDYPFGLPDEWISQDMERMESGWGLEYTRHAVAELDPSVAADRRFIEWYARYLRRGASPGGALALTRMWNETDMRGVLPAIHVPTLILCRPDASFPLQGGAADRYLADRIPGAKIVELPGTDFNFWTNGAEGVLEAIQGFIANAREEEAEFDRVLGTVVFTDIVGSTQKAAELGDSGRAGVARLPRLQGRGGRLRDVLRRGLVGLADGEVEHGRARGLERRRALGHGHGRRDLDRARAHGEVARRAVPLHRLHARLRRRSPSGGGPGYFSRKRRSTTGGTSSCTPPPSWKTSLTMRDERYE